jgi:uncharacterized protein YcbX
VPELAWISIAPVKGLALVHPEEVELGLSGVAENRRFCLIDADGRRYGALRDGRLQTIVPTYDAPAGQLALRFPDGTVVDGEIRLGAETTTDLYQWDLPVRLVEGPWSEALSRFLDVPVTLVYAGGPTGSVDRPRGPVTLVSEASLEELGRQAGLERPVDGRRFRMLFGVTGCEPHKEDGWIGREVAVGDAVVRIDEPVARCAITTQNPETGAPDLDTLRIIPRYRGVRDGKKIDFGVVGSVARPGRVRLGDPVHPVE